MPIEKPENSNVLKKDIYVELELRAIRNGVEWSRIPMKIPMQSEASYFVIEGALNDALRSIGVMAGQDVFASQTEEAAGAKAKP